MITQPLRNWMVIRRQKVFLFVQMVCLDPDYQDTLSLLCDLAARVCNDSISQIQFLYTQHLLLAALDSSRIRHPCKLFSWGSIN